MNRLTQEYPEPEGSVLGRSSFRTPPEAQFPFPYGVRASTPGVLRRGEGFVAMTLHEREHRPTGRARRTVRKRRELAAQGDRAELVGLLWMKAREGHVLAMPRGGVKARESVPVGRYPTGRGGADAAGGRERAPVSSLRRRRNPS